MYVVGIASAIFAAIIFLPAMQGAGFQWTRANWCRVGLAVLCAYIGLTAVAHHKAFADVQHLAASQNMHVESLAAMPLPPTLTHWVGLVSTPQGVWRTTFHEPGGAIENTQFYADSQPSDLIEQARKLRDVQVFLWFARYPVWRTRQRDDRQTVIDISDVRFFRENIPGAAGAPQPPRGISDIRPRPAGFTFQIVFDADGHIISHGFREPE